MKHLLRKYEAAACAAMKSETKHAQSSLLFPTFFTAEGRFILHALISAAQ